MFKYLQSLTLVASIFAIPASGASSLNCQELLKTLNQTYSSLHTEKENAFWATRMGLPGTEPAAFQTAEKKLKEFTSDPSFIRDIEAALADPTIGQMTRVGLEGWLDFFRANSIRSEEAKIELKRLIEMEAKLYQDRYKIVLKFNNPITGEEMKGSTVYMRNLIQSEPHEAVRMAAFQTLLNLEDQILELNFIDVVKQRNKLARLLGFSDYYEYKVQTNERMSKQEVFGILDNLVAQTDEKAKNSMDSLVDRYGPEVLDPWNFGYLTGGDLTKQLDPYYPFTKAVERWGKTFAGLGVDYQGAKIQIDLVDRPGTKYSNGFMHGPVPALLNSYGDFRPAHINFSANAIPSQVGSGKSATKTLLHEGGHAAHFANIRMPAASYAQEFAPTSVAYTETQSMFMDSLHNDTDWMARYARTESGEAMSVKLQQTFAIESHRAAARNIRTMLVVPYFEKGLYEMPEDQLSAASIKQLARSIETRFSMTNEYGTALVTTVPHILGGESSAYYHGYVLAELAVYQIKDYFTHKYGYILDNPNIGPELARYWQPGNRLTFKQFVERLTGKPLSADAALAKINRTDKQVLEDVNEDLFNEANNIPHRSGAIQLNGRFFMVHGPDLITTNTITFNDKAAFEEMASEYEAWLRTLSKKQ